MRGGKDAATGSSASISPTALRETPIGDAAVPRLELQEWATRFGLTAGITTRPMSLGLWSDESVGQVMGRWRAFRAAFARSFPSMVLSHQVHGTDIRWHAGRADGWVVLDGIDGHATTDPGVLLTITVADCIPVYLAVPEKGTIALLHAGWRGVAGNVLERGVQLLRQRAFVRSSEIVMHCGVGICENCYEVGEEVMDALRRSSARGGTILRRDAGQSGPSHVDLRALLAQQAGDLGIGDWTVSSWCSAHDRAQFFSHRASGGRDGRMVAYLGRPLTAA